jgi:hypothetical protein
MSVKECVVVCFFTLLIAGGNLDVQLGVCI